MTGGKPEILTPRRRAEFFEAADTMIRLRQNQSLVAAKLSRDFGLDREQVKGLCWRMGLKLSLCSDAHRSVTDLDEKESTKLLELGRKYLDQGMDKAEIRFKLAERFNLLERAVVYRLRRYGIDISASQNEIENAQRDAADRAIKEAKNKSADVITTDTNILVQAASKVKGGRYDTETGLCYIGRIPVSGLKLLSEAKMELV